jgi:hypothetical protein
MRSVSQSMHQKNATYATKKRSLECVQYYPVKSEETIEKFIP